MVSRIKAKRDQSMDDAAKKRTVKNNAWKRAFSRAGSRGRVGAVVPVASRSSAAHSGSVGKISEGHFGMTDKPADRNTISVWKFQLTEAGGLFRRHMRKDTNGYLTMVLTIAMLFSYIQIWQGDLTPTVAFLSVFSVILLVFLLIAQISVWLDQVKDVAPNSFLRRSSIWGFSLQCFIWGEFEGIFCLVVSFTFSFAMVFRVAKGSCLNNDGFQYSSLADEYSSWWVSVRGEDGTSIPPTLSCNPNDTTGGLPYDTLILMYTLPLIIKFCLKGTHIYAVFASIVTSTSFLLYAAIAQLENANGNVWIIINLTASFLFLVYEYERFNISSFLTNKRALEDALVSEREKYEKEAMVLIAQKDQTHNEVEHDMLRSLIGNVAHDLKTPLLSLTMGLEQLEPLLSSPVDFNITAFASYGSNDTPDHGQHCQRAAAATEDERVSSAQELIYNMQASCSFMTMAINRAIDYTKASRNIALVPKFESFDVFGALEFQIRCINSLRASSSAPSAQLEIVPTSLAHHGTAEKHMCRFMLTDRLWLTENLLCLLSNAVKFSDDDTITKVTVQLIPALQPLVPSTSNHVTAAATSTATTNTENNNDNKDNPTTSTKCAPIAEDEDCKSNDLSSSLVSNNHSRSNSAAIGLPLPRRRRSTPPYPDHGGGGGGEGGFKPLGSQSERGALVPLLPLDLHPPEEVKRKSLSYGLPSKSPDSFRFSGGGGSLSSSSAAAAIGAGGISQAPPNGGTGAGTPTFVNDATACVDMIRVIVEDTGVGLSDDAKKTLFKPFQQAQRFTGGTGLGLYSLSKRLDSLGGFFGVTDRLDGKRGCLFWFAFPYRPDFAAEEALKSEAEELLAERLAAEAEAALLADGNLVDLAPMSLSSPPEATPSITASRPHPSARVGDTAPMWTTNIVGSMFPRNIAGTVLPSMVPGMGCSTTSGRQSAPVSRQMSSRQRSKRIASIRGVQIANKEEIEQLKLRVLVVDDSLTILKMVSRTLEQHGFTVETAKNGSIGLYKLIESNLKPYSTSSGEMPSDLTKRFDIVLMDLQMPVMDGIEAVTCYRSDEMKTILAAKTQSAVAPFSPPQKSSSQKKRNGSTLGTNLPEFGGSPVASSLPPFSPTTVLSPGIVVISDPAEDMDHASAMMTPLVRLKFINDRCTQFRKPAPAFASRMASRMGSRMGSPQAAVNSPQNNICLLLQQLLQQPMVPIVIIGMSANSDAESKQCAKDAGMDYFIEKPFAMSDFLRIVDNIEKEE